MDVSIVSPERTAQLTIRMSASKIFGSEKAEVQKAGEIRKKWFIYLYCSPNIFFVAQQPLVYQDLLIIEGFTSTFRHTAIGRIPLDE
jgi:hypothetical protein